MNKPNRCIKSPTYIVGVPLPSPRKLSSNLLSPLDIVQQVSRVHLSRRHEWASTVRAACPDPHQSKLAKYSFQPRSWNISERCSGQHNFLHLIQFPVMVEPLLKLDHCPDCLLLIQLCRYPRLMTFPRDNEVSLQPAQYGII